LAASSLVLGALLGAARPWPDRLIGVVLAFGAGALISAVSFDLAEEGAQVGDRGVLAAGLAIGAFTYFAADRLIGKKSARRGGRAGQAGTSLALGAFLDGLPEQAVLGIGIAAGEGVSVGLLVAIFVSNLPEAIGSSTEMRAAGTSPGAIQRLWVAVAVVCALATFGLRGGRQRRRQLPRLGRRVRRGRVVGDVDRLDDPGGGAQGRGRVRPGHRARLRGRGRPVGDLVSTDRDAARHAILALLARRAPGKTICPSDAARALAGDDAFRPLMDTVRDAARELVAEGEIDVTQRGEVVDLDAARGPIRLRARRAPRPGSGSTPR
jgi:ZIP family zinc transporter